ncbi:glycosyltransferase family 4 protein [Entomobacter blattae]|uniref:D-inositol-3-phosphate glycosyltransferase n=1 Tax=Entomobacter blattae TaxID=2762277 RepID=A0A7H1NQS7_9PROT|nr:glycosyltransferase family 4 protein [Entomobacter blattae]QNT78137.1 D-inositol-3-phosphate glycosyltransferase [Entomobacter blattae]
MRVLSVLPPREGFSDHNIGAIGLLVAHQAVPGDRIVGRSLPPGVKPYRQKVFLPVPSPPCWLSPFPLKAAARYAAGVSKLINRVKPELVEVHNRPEIMLRLIRRFPTLPFILYIHNDPQGMRGAKTVRQRSLLLRKSQVMCVSHWLRARLIEDVPEKLANQCGVLPNSIAVPPIEDVLPLKQRQKTLLFAGRLVADKGVDLLLKAWEGVKPHRPGWQLRLIGADRFSPNSPTTPFLKEFLPMAHKAGVRVDGYRPHQDVLQAMAESAVVVVPSRWEEPFGMTALEAMAAGTPVIAANRGGLPEVVGQGGLVLNPEDTQGLIQALLSVTGDQALWGALSAKGYQQACQFAREDIVRHRQSLRRAVLRKYPFGPLR